jgi:hypothetical protein
MNDQAIVTETFALAKRDLGLEGEFDALGAEDAYERLFAFLQSRVNELLDRDMERLMNALYRIDVPEKQVKEILHLAQPEEISGALTKAILDREKQKVITRRQYRQS